MGMEVGLPPQLLNLLGKNNFEASAKRVVNKQKKEVEEDLTQVNLQIKNIESKNKRYIKEFVEENYESLIERPPFDFSMLSEFFR
jgi:hypothetical protein